MKIHQSPGPSQREETKRWREGEKSPDNMSPAKTFVLPLNLPFLSVINLAAPIPAVRRSCYMLSGFMLFYAASFSNHLIRVVSHICPVFCLSASSVSLCPLSCLIIILMLCDTDLCRTPAVCLMHDYRALTIRGAHHDKDLKLVLHFDLFLLAPQVICELMLQSAKIQSLWTCQQSEWFMLSNSIAIF